MAKRKTTAPRDLVLDLLRELRRKMDLMHADLKDVKHRVTAIEISTATLLGSDALKSDRLDRLESRLERVEQRLQLREAT